MYVVVRVVVDNINPKSNTKNKPKPTNPQTNVKRKSKSTSKQLYSKRSLRFTEYSKEGSNAYAKHGSSPLFIRAGHGTPKSKRFNRLVSYRPTSRLGVI
jgi:hypothetical protein